MATQNSRGGSPEGSRLRGLRMANSPVGQKRFFNLEKPHDHYMDLSLTAKGTVTSKVTAAKKNIFPINVDKSGTHEDNYSGPYKLTSESYVEPRKNFKHQSLSHLRRDQHTKSISSVSNFNKNVGDWGPGKMHNETMKPQNRMQKLNDIFFLPNPNGQNLNTSKKCQDARKRGNPKSSERSHTPPSANVTQIFTGVGQKYYKSPEKSRLRSHIFANSNFHGRPVGDSLVVLDLKNAKGKFMESMPGKNVIYKNSS